MINIKNTIIIIVFIHLFTIPLFADVADYRVRTAIKLTPVFYPRDNTTWSLRSDGRVYFFAIRQADDVSGLYITGGPGGYQPIAVVGDVAPEIIGATFQGISSTWVGHEHGFTFAAYLEGNVNEDNNLAFYVGGVSSVAKLIYRKGDDVPNTNGYIFKYPPSEIKVNDAGDVLFMTTVFNPTTNDYIDVIIFYQNNTMSLIANEGVNQGVTGFALNPQSTIAYNTNDNGIIKLMSGKLNNIQVIASVGDTIATTSSPILHFNSFTFGKGDKLAFNTRLDPLFYAIYYDIDSNAPLVFQSSNNNDSLGSLSADSNGKVTFLDGEHITSQQNGELTTIASPLEQAPNMPNGVVFSDITHGLNSNEFRQVVFAAMLNSDNINTSNDFSLWIYDPNFGLQAIAREGSSIEIKPADTRTISYITPYIRPESYQDGANISFNRRGEIAFLVKFTDGEMAIVVGQIQPHEILFYNSFE